MEGLSNPGIVLSFSAAGLAIGFLLYIMIHRFRMMVQFKQNRKKYITYTLLDLAFMTGLIGTFLGRGQLLDIGRLIFSLLALISLISIVKFRNFLENEEKTR